MIGNKKYLYLFLEDMEHILRHTQPLWELLRKKSLFVTGGTGFFGKWLLESFLYANEQLTLDTKITILTRNPRKFIEDFPLYNRKGLVEFIEGDIVTFDFPMKKYQYIIHAAANSSDSNAYQTQPLTMLDTITLGTRRILDFTKQQPVESFLFVSSGAIYGKQPADISHISETDSFFIDLSDSNSSYAEGKRLSELYCSIYFKEYKLPVKIARCFAFVGPFLPLDRHFAIGNFIRDGLQGNPIQVRGDGTPYRSYLYIADLTIWLWKVFLMGKNRYPYNVGSEEDITIGDLATIVAKSFQPKLEVQISKHVESGKPVERYIPCTRRASSELNVQQYIDLQESIRRTVQWNGTIRNYTGNSIHT